jgi:hypothetical protein
MGARFVGAATGPTVANKDPQFGAADLETSIARILSSSTEEQRLRVSWLIAAYGIDDAFKNTLVVLGARLAAGRQPLPADLRKHEEITPEERAIVFEAADRLRAARDIALEGAKSTNTVEDLALLGRGVPVGKTIDTITAGLQTFLAAGSPARGPAPRRGLHASQAGSAHQPARTAQGSLGAHRDAGVRQERLSAASGARRIRRGLVVSGPRR